uniref:Uncharacterized protein n=1 Tax=Hyaloperonospora arabidopsidis (strain Emoy2) TaxID=559515 RepID=M4BJ69_HYAAE
MTKLSSGVAVPSSEVNVQEMTENNIDAKPELYIRWLWSMRDGQSPSPDQSTALDVNQSLEP